MVGDDPSGAPPCSPCTLFRSVTLQKRRLVRRFRFLLSKHFPPLPAEAGCSVSAHGDRKTCLRPGGRSSAVFEKSEDTACSHGL